MMETKTLFKVFPCAAKDQPLINDWYNQASNDPEQIKLWQELWKDKLKYWGIPCGPANDIFVLDIDIKNENGFKTLADNNLQIPPTMHQRSQSGGAHYIFKYPKDGQHYGNRVKFLPGLDTRGAGGYIIYYGLDNTPIAEAPDWLLKQARKTQYDHTGPVVAVAPTVAEPIITAALEAIREAPPGESNNTLNTHSFKVGQLVASNVITREYAEQILLKAALERGKPEREARATIKSGLDGGHHKPLTAPFSAPQIVIPIPLPSQTQHWTPNLFTLEDLTNFKMLRKPQLFRDWSTEDIHLTTADGGTGKTTLKMFEAVCLALGIPFLGFDCVTPGKTLFITGEDTAGKLGAMIGQICKQMDIINNPQKMEIILNSIIVKKDSDLCLVTKDRQGFLHPNMNALEYIREAINKYKPKMIVFDPISKFWGSEAALNDMANAVSKFMNILVDEANACVEMINHMGKASSSQKDMSQFAGRGGTGLPSHARVSRVLRGITDEEYSELTGLQLGFNQSAMVCNVAKFTDGSPLFNKQFLIVRDGYLFSRKYLDAPKERELETQVSDIERVYRFICECRKANKYPTMPVIVGHFMNSGDPISEARAKRAVTLLTFNGFEGTQILKINNPDVVSKESVYILADSEGREIQV